ncbi:MAG: single-stranded-DNA-specific exonuclease RecJ [Planctomycetes bacterium]|nr:single-stranded-DNA-specific exonuclease RecJ [Planctomycetota bacterium]MCW8136796.1 single-stranded-DNA-specific exonuclease RecJ [Planctomycetota bacterium]
MSVDPAWVVASQPGNVVRDLAGALRIPEHVARVLYNRGVRDSDAAARFLQPSSLHLEDPFSFRQMDRAVDRIRAALAGNEKVMVQGDYDVDGSASAALLVNFFRVLGREVEVSIPSRAEDGYGLNERAIRRAAESGVKLLITCDNGTTAHKEIALAAELGIDTIVTDHHTVGETLPPAVAVLNPHVKDENLQFRDLCGAGVAFKLAWGVMQRVSYGSGLDSAYRDFLAGAQSLVAMASVADVVPLTGENRVLTRTGLRLMPDSPNPGIRALMETSGIKGVPSGVDVGFKIAPRLNAGGRLGRETLALELLTARSYGDALQLAQEAEGLNRQRQSVDRGLTKLAEELVLSDASYERDRVLVLHHDEFHPGVVGIVAARISRRFNKPTVLVAMNGEVGRGSGRSIPGFHLYNALNDCASLMQRFGGHEQAAGMEITRENIGHLRRAVNEIADRHVMQADYATPTLNIDATVALSQLEIAGINLLAGLEPFGHGNPEPVFMAENIEVASDPRVVGKGTGHLSLMLKQAGNVAFKSIGFGMGERVAEAGKGAHLRIAFTPRISEFRGYPEVELELKDLRRA